jgi:hypothetical protein
MRFFFSCHLLSIFFNSCHDTINYSQRAEAYEKLGKKDLAKTDREIPDLLTYGLAQRQFLPVEFKGFE